MTNREIIICRDAGELSRKAAEQWVALARQAIAARGRCAIALSGGSTPKALYSLLATAEFNSQIEWRRIHLFWGDERCVSPDHSDSNFRMTRENLLDYVPLPAENIHRMPGEMEPIAAASAYEAELKKFFGAGLPRFDLVFLGLGDDGHTASLFPGGAALDERERLVATTYVAKLNAHRLTLTFPVINNAAQIAFLVAGESKSAIVKEILTTEKCNYPAARIRPENGQLIWFVTQDAASDMDI